MSRLSEYTEYKIMAIYNPYNFYHFSVLMRTRTLEEVLHRQYELCVNLYDEYLQECLAREVTPLSEYMFRKTEWDVFDRPHESIYWEELTFSDKRYISGLPEEKAERKGFINQNICLFYKSYFKRRWNQKTL